MQFEEMRFNNSESITMTTYYMTRAGRWNGSNGLMDVKVAGHADETTLSNDQTYIKLHVQL